MENFETGRLRQGGSSSASKLSGGVALGRRETYFAVMLLTSIDRWVGRTLFIPPIIKLCQLTRQSQFAIARLFWFITALDGFCRADTLFSSLLWGALSLIMMFTASRRADSPTTSLLIFRVLSVGLLVFRVIEAVVARKWAGTEFWIFVLIAEYAATIRAIPPANLRKSTAKATLGR